MAEHGKDWEGANATMDTVKNIILHLNNIRRQATSATKLTTRFAEIVFHKVRISSILLFKTTLPHQ